ncbi:MAG: Calx-beta domain-containing protein [Acidimicrobiales bacterium]
MSRNQKIIAAAVAAVVVVAGVVVWATTGSGGSNKSNSVVIFSRVQRRVLEDTVALTGTLARKEIRNITASNEGLVNKVNSTNGSFARAGDSMFQINGRRAIAENGSVAFFRSLAPGDQGDDVLQLKQILAAAGDYPGPMNNQFTQQTQFALAQWQAQNHYPNSTPANPESVTVALEQGAGYKVGSQDSAGLIIGPPPAQTTADDRHAGARAVLADMASGDPTPVLTIQSVDTVVPQGTPATFVVQASAASATDLTVNLTSGGTAGPGDVISPPTSVVLPAGSTSTSVPVQTRANNTVEAEPTLVLSLAPGSGYSVGSPGSAQTTITNNNVPSLQITGGSTISAGATTTLTVTANQAPLQNIQVDLELGGSAAQGTDYDPVNPVLTLNAGSTSTSVTINTLKTTTIEPTKYIVVSLSPSPSSYSIGATGSAVVTISGSGGTPTATLTSATAYLQKGEPYQVTVSLSQATSSPMTVHLSYGGTAVQGTDFTIPGGALTVPAGQTALVVSIPTVTDNVVESDRVLTVSLAPGSGYQIGSPATTSVTITSSVVPTLTITSNTGTVTQGGAASFTITADQAPVKDTSVGFSVQGTAQPGQNYVPLTGTALLKAGQTQVSVVLQSIQNNVVFEPTDMIVGQWPTRVGQVFVKAGAPVTPGEPILSLTETDLSVTLQATAADRSKLRVGQHATVQIDGENNVSSGTITELDSSPTEVSSGTGQSQQVYEGRIEVPNISGADGSQVSITVIDQQITDAVTVPIAAVKQNGSGVSVVRVINLATGRITEVPVTTGLTEGSYIQITHGLRLGQIVLVQVDQSS